MTTLNHLLAAALWGALVLSSPAASADDLSGAWATDGSACDKIFVKAGSRVTFRDNSELFGGGFVIDGNHVRGKATTCDIRSRKTVGTGANAVTHMLASCASDIMLSSVQLSVRQPAPDTLVRIFPGMDGMEMTYKRCAM
ncbi:hypothetical protein [Rhodoplanes azumiensis]|uniref:Secreted protein n=1 Tax=Rhodoplanes azumiensis TaxID=1897628 RepID=A0ABW5AIC6_9BRAD